MPRHVAFILDGNGRWAQARGKSREYGHKYGAENFRKVVNWCRDRGIGTITAYVFSTENWQRPQKEVDTILGLLDGYLDDCISDMKKYEVEYRFLGDKGVFTPALRRKMEWLARESAGRPWRVNLALNYGSRSELTRAFRLLAEEGKTEITEADVERVLYTEGSPELDLIVRTGGELRLSNFLLWQAAYAEFYFTDTLWPDFNEAELDRALASYGARNRRYGGVPQ
jgi:undecaprenyl diphosphate synthase